MRCRRLKEDNNKQNVVWFGSYGVNSDGTAKFYNESNKHDNYSDNQQGVADSLTQRLSIIRQELWYAITYGLPLLEKNYSKAVIDAAAFDIISNHPDVTNISKYNSKIDGHKYSADVLITTVYGPIKFSV